MSSLSLGLAQSWVTPQDARRHAVLLSYFCRAFFAVTLFWGLAELAAYLSGNLGQVWQPSLVVIGELLATTVLSYWQLRRRRWRSATYFLLVGMLVAIAVAEWYFVQQIPEVHLGYLVPIVLAATFLSSTSGGLVALISAGVDAFIRSYHAGGSALLTDPRAFIGFLVLSATFVILAVIVGRYASNLTNALGRAEEKTRAAETANAQAVKYSVELEEAYVQTVLALARAVEAKDTYTADHAERLANWALQVAARLGIRDAEELQAIGWGTRLHDVGKIGVPDSVLQKPGKLDGDEWKLMRQHPGIGSEILRPMSRMRSAAAIVRHHHERWDGTGYPDGLKAEAIPLGARILTVVDAYSAMIDERVYKPAHSAAYAIAELEKNKGSQFDSKVVDMFLEVLGIVPSDSLSTIPK